MNATQFMAAWDSHEFSICLNHLAKLNAGEMGDLCKAIPDSDMGKISSVFFYARQMTNAQTSAYAALVSTKLKQLANSRIGKNLDLAASACNRLSLSVAEHMECSHLRGGSQAKQDVFDAYTVSLSCLRAQSEISGPDLVNQKLADRWADALSYDFKMIERVEVKTVAFINKIVTLRGDRIASTMLYSLKQQSNLLPLDERTAGFSKGVDGMIAMLGKCDLLVVPKDVEPLIKEIDCIAQYFHNQDEKPLIGARNALLKWLLDPEHAGRWLGNSYAKSGRKPLDLTQIKKLSMSIDRALEKPESHELHDLRWRYKIGLINAIGRLSGTPSIIENAVVNLIRNCEDDQIKVILSRVTSRAAVIMARGIGRRLPEKVRLITPKLGEKIFAVDLGL